MDEGLLHIAVMIEQHQRKRSADLLCKQLCHIMIITIVQEMDAMRTIVVQSFAQLSFRFIGAVHAGARDVAEVDPLHAGHTLFDIRRTDMGKIKQQVHFSSSFLIKELNIKTGIL